MAQKANEVTVDDLHWKIMVLGDYGTGKSYFASTFPGPMYVFDFDKHILGFRERDDVFFDQFDMSYLGWVNFEKVIIQVAKDVKEGKYKTVVLDSLTSMADVCMERAMQLDPKRGPDEGPIWNVHYMIVKNLMSAKLRKLLSFHCNLIFNGHWALEKDPKTGAILSAEPFLTGALSTTIPGLFSEVYSATTQTIGKETKFWLNLVTRGHYKARSLVSGPLRLLPDRVSNDWPTLRKYIDELTASGKLKTKKGGDDG